MNTTYTTSKGVKGRTGTSRRFIVVAHSLRGPIIFYRTSVWARADAFANKGSGREVIDLRPFVPSKKTPHPELTSSSEHGTVEP
jgi:hypothetical protein